ncbi:MAG: SHOCT domain-containing protein [Desulfomonilaceae bacterium]
MPTFYQDEGHGRVKNPRTAFLLALLLGPIGMFYVTVTWAAIMLFLNIALGVVTYGLAIVILWPLGARIAYRLAYSRNTKSLPQSETLPTGGLLTQNRAYKGFLDRWNETTQRSEGPSDLVPRTESAKRAVQQYRRKKLPRWGVALALTVSRKCSSALSLKNLQGKSSLKNHPQVTTTDTDASSSPFKTTRDQYCQNFELRLRNLKNLKDKGLIDEKEFRARKTAILDEI